MSPNKRSIRARTSAPTAFRKQPRLALMRQYALDYGADGIRANAVNADRIRSGLLTADMIALALKSARLEREGLHERQPARPRGYRRRRRAGVPTSGAGAQDQRPTSPPSTAAISPPRCGETGALIVSFTTTLDLTARVRSNARATKGARHSRLLFSRVLAILHDCKKLRRDRPESRNVLSDLRLESATRTQAALKASFQDCWQL